MTNKRKGQRVGQVMDYLVGTDYDQKTFRRNLDMLAYARNKKSQYRRSVRKVAKLEKMYSDAVRTLGETRGS